MPKTSCFSKIFISLSFIFYLYSTKINPKSLAFFSPDDDPQSKLVNLINQTKYKIQVAIYALTNKKIAQALIEATKRGVKIELITDQSAFNMRTEKISSFKNSGIEVFVFSQGLTKKMRPLMHNKFAIFELDDKEENKNINKWIWTGSFNWTVSANRMNQENVILTSNKKIYAKYKKQFEILKRRCVLKNRLTSKKVMKKNQKVENTKEEDSELIENVKKIFYAIKEHFKN